MKRGEHDRLRGPFKHFREMLMTLTTVTQLANSTCSVLYCVYSKRFLGMPLFQRTQWYDVDQFRQLGIPQPGDRVKFKRKRNGVVPYTVSFTDLPGTGAYMAKTFLTMSDFTLPHNYYRYINLCRRPFMESDEEKLFKSFFKCNSSMALLETHYFSTGASSKRSTSMDTSM